MWQRYRSTFLWAQAVIVLVAAAVYYRDAADLKTTLMLFAVMQAANVAGAWWGARLQRRIEARMSGLPLTHG